MKKRRTNWTAARVAALVDGYAAGLTPAKLAREVRVPESAVRDKLKRLGLRLRSRARRRLPCLTCGSPFPSAGPGNRVCEACKTSDLFRGLAA